MIENGAEFFNRPLYGGNSASRVDRSPRALANEVVIGLMPATLSR